MTNSSSEKVKPGGASAAERQLQRPCHEPQKKDRNRRGSTKAAAAADLFLHEGMVATASAAWQLASASGAAVTGVVGCGTQAAGVQVATGVAASPRSVGKATGAFHRTAPLQLQLVRPAPLRDPSSASIWTKPSASQPPGQVSPRAATASVMAAPLAATAGPHSVDSSPAVHDDAMGCTPPVASRRAAAAAVYGISRFTDVSAAGPMVITPDAGPRTRHGVAITAMAWGATGVVPGLGSVAGALMGGGDGSGGVGEPMDITPQRTPAQGAQLDRHPLLPPPPPSAPAAAGTRLGGTSQGSSGGGAGAGGGSGGNGGCAGDEVMVICETPQTEMVAATPTPTATPTVPYVWRLSLDAAPNTVTLSNRASYAGMGREAAGAGTASAAPAASGTAAVAAAALEAAAAGEGVGRRGSDMTGIVDAFRSLAPGGWPYVAAADDGAISEWGLQIDSRVAAAESVSLAGEPLCLGGAESLADSQGVSTDVVHSPVTDIVLLEAADALQLCVVIPGASAGAGAADYDLVADELGPEDLGPGRLDPDQDFDLDLTQDERVVCVAPRVRQQLTRPMSVFAAPPPLQLPPSAAAVAAAAAAGAAATGHQQQAGPTTYRPRGSQAGAATAAAPTAAAAFTAHVRSQAAVMAYKAADGDDDDDSWMYSQAVSLRPLAFSQRPAKAEVRGQGRGRLEPPPAPLPRAPQRRHGYYTRAAALALASAAASYDGMSYRSDSEEDEEVQAEAEAPEGGQGRARQGAEGCKWDAFGYEEPPGVRAMEAGATAPQQQQQHAEEEERKVSGRNLEALTGRAVSAGSTATSQGLGNGTVAAQAGVVSAASYGQHAAAAIAAGRVPVAAAPTEAACPSAPVGFSAAAMSGGGGGGRNGSGVVVVVAATAAGDIADGGGAGGGGRRTSRPRPTPVFELFPDIPGLTLACSQRSKQVPKQQQHHNTRHSPQLTQERDRRRARQPPPPPPLPTPRPPQPPPTAPPAAAAAAPYHPVRGPATAPLTTSAVTLVPSTQAAGPAPVTASCRAQAPTLASSSSSSATGSAAVTFAPAPAVTFAPAPAGLHTSAAVLAAVPLAAPAPAAAAHGHTTAPAPAPAAVAPPAAFAAPAALPASAASIPALVAAAAAAAPAQAAAGRGPAAAQVQQHQQQTVVVAALGEECRPAFWEGAPDLYEVFPFQRQALDFADWVNASAPSTLRGLMRAVAGTDFASFADRWRFLADWMEKHPATGAAAAAAAATVREGRPVPLPASASGAEAATEGKGPSAAAMDAAAPAGVAASTRGEAPDLQPQRDRPGRQLEPQPRPRPLQADDCSGGDGADAVMGAEGEAPQGQVQQRSPRHLQQQQGQQGQEQQGQGQQGQGQQGQEQQGQGQQCQGQQHVSVGGKPQPQPQRRPLEAVRVFVREHRRGATTRGGAAAGGGGGGAGGGAEYSRHFVVTTYRGIWRRYQGLQSTQRHFYEVIRGDRPCHMYFDIEFSRGANPGADGDALVEVVVRRLGELLRDTWGLQLCPTLHVLELESITEAEAAAATKAAAAAAAGDAGATGGSAGAVHSAPAVAAAPWLVDKFSRHLVIRLPGVALSSNAVAGAIVARMRPLLQADGLCLLKASEAPGGATACIVDPAVYSRFRHFRMIWCSKGGKESVLRPTRRFMMAPPPPPAPSPSPPHPHPRPPGQGAPGPAAAAPGAGTAAPFGGPQQLFLASLICNVHPEARLLEVPPGFLEGLPPLLRGLASGGHSSGAAAGGGASRYSTTAVVLEANVIHESTRRPVKLTWAAEPPELRLAAPPPPSDPQPPPEHQQHRHTGMPPPPPQQQQQQQQQQPQMHPSRPRSYHEEARLPYIDPRASPSAAAASTSAPATSSAGDGGGVGGGGSLLRRLALAAVPFVEVMAADRAGGAEAQVRSMAYCGEGASVTYGMIGPGSHFCDRIGRRHRSNHVFFLLDFLRGSYCQKCYDPECAGWRSEWTAMPLETWQHNGAPLLAMVPAAPQQQPAAAVAMAAAAGVGTTAQASAMASTSAGPGAAVQGPDCHSTHSYALRPDHQIVSVHNAMAATYAPSARWACGQGSSGGGGDRCGGGGGQGSSGGGGDRCGGGGGASTADHPSTSMAPLAAQAGAAGGTAAQEMGLGWAPRLGAGPGYTVRAPSGAGQGPGAKKGPGGSGGPVPVSVLFGGAFVHPR